MLLIVLLGLSALTKGQIANQIMVEYTENNGFNINMPTFLFANEDSSIFVEDTLVENAQQFDQMRNENQRVYVANDLNRSPIHYIQYRNQSIVPFDIKLFGRKYAVIDSLPPFNWIIDSAKREKVCNYDCHVAYLDYRGSRIRACYTTEIPIPFGPFKFKGLPGLILKIVDETPPRVFGQSFFNSWTATKITFPYSKTYRVDIFVPNSQQISLRRAIVLGDKMNRETSEKMNSRLDALYKSEGVNVLSTRTASSVNQLPQVAIEKSMNGEMNENIQHYIWKFIFFYLSLS